MHTIYFLRHHFALDLLRSRLTPLLHMMHILCVVHSVVVIIPTSTWWWTALWCAATLARGWRTRWSRRSSSRMASRSWSLRMRRGLHPSRRALRALLMMRNRRLNGQPEGSEAAPLILRRRAAPS